VRPHRFFEFLDAALDQLMTEQAPSYAAVCDAIGDYTVRVVAGGDAARLHVRATRVRIIADGQEFDIAAHLDPALVTALVDGDTNLLDALLDDRLELTGSMPAVEAMLDCMTAFVAGTLRCHGTAALSRQYRRRFGAIH
jgi:hypothetical protein